MAGKDKAEPEQEETPQSEQHEDDQDANFSKLIFPEMDKVSVLKKPDVELTGKEKAGVNLTWGVLTIISSVLFIIFVFIFIDTYKYPPAPIFPVIPDEIIGDLTVEQFLAYTDALRQNVEAQKEARREFILDIIEKVVVNVLLPVLTALLGYIFGTSSNIGNNTPKDE